MICFPPEGTNICLSVPSYMIPTLTNFYRLVADSILFHYPLGPLIKRFNGRHQIYTDVVTEVNDKWYVRSQ